MRHRSKLKQNHQIPEEYEYPQIIIQNIAIVVILIFLTIWLVAIISMALKSRYMQQEPKLMVQSNINKQSGTTVNTYYTDFIEIHDGVLCFMDSHGMYVQLNNDNVVITTLFKNEEE